MLTPNWAGANMDPCGFPFSPPVSIYNTFQWLVPLVISKIQIRIVSWKVSDMLPTMHCHTAFHFILSGGWWERQVFVCKVLMKCGDQSVCDCFSDSCICVFVVLLSAVQSISFSERSFSSTLIIHVHHFIRHYLRA